MSDQNLFFFDFEPASSLKVIGKDDFILSNNPLDSSFLKESFAYKEI